MTQCRVLMVAEKPSLAESLSRLLAPGGKYETTKATTPVHEWIGTFQDQPAKFHFTSVTGHVYQIDFVQEFNSWDVDPQKLFDARTKKTEANPKMRLTQHLQREAKGVDYLVLWLDCDREGENICFEVIENCLPYMKQLHKADQVLRARFSAITAQEIQKSIKNLVKPNENEAKAVDARQEFDLKVGVAFTRFQTKFFQGKYGNLDSTVISSGPCQTPTLSFCVERHDRIQSFQPESYWSISATIKRNDIPTKLVWERERMGLAERLYMQGYISYPRTETSKYPESFDIDFVLREQAQHSMWGDYCHDLLAHGFDRPTGGTDIGDHPPITPIHIAEESELPGNAWRLYEFIARTFIGSISPNLQYISTKVVFSIGDESFECKGSRVTSPGFTSIMHWLNKADEYIPEFKKDDILPISALVIQEGKTGPPDYLTESELIGLMEQHGIGTDASIPTHINNICQRNYIQVSGSSRKLVPTNLGIVLIHGYVHKMIHNTGAHSEKIDPELSLPTMRSDMEQQLSLIASGKAPDKDVLQHFLSIFEKKFSYFVSRIERMDELFEATFEPLAATGKPLSKCGKCKRYMKYIALKPNRLHCATCDETYSLPLNGNIKLYRELRCPLDDFELVLYSTGSKGTGYPICPYCYNSPPFENITKGMGCNHCPHPTCPHSMVKNAVCPCPESEREVDSCKGRLVLDATSAPRWKLSCNECNIVSSFVDTVKHVEMVDELCDCGASILKAEFRENQNKQPISGCIMCDEDMDTLLVTRHMHDTHQIQVSDEVTFFKLHDLDGDGFWDDRELRAMYGLERDIDPNAVHVKTIINRAFEELDTGRDGLISLTEYMRSKLPNWTEEEKKAEKRWKEEHQDEKATTLHQRSLHDDLPQWEEDKAEEGEGVVPDKYRA
ncbi:DNA topoisomerase 3-beta-1 [Apophysomyces sp. BC1021]|nr:DNA topoisomerase 3-beta-1 [Apophysomyces sp. BC1021]